MGLNNIGFYFITDSKITKKPITQQVKEALAADVKIIQYREKTKKKQAMIKELKKIKKLAKGKALLIVNDYLTLAKYADGVHLGQDESKLKKAREKIKDRILGITVHNYEEAKEAITLGADYLAVSPVFISKTKLDAGKPISITEIEKIKTLKIPLVAIGGITLKNVDIVLKMGIKNIVAISDVLKSRSIAKRIRQYQKKIILS